MNEELKIIIKAVNDQAKKAVGEVKGEIDKLSKSAKTFSGKITAVMKGIAKGAMIVIGAIAAVGAALLALGKNSLQVAREQAKLQTAFEAAGSSAQQAAESYNNLYRFLGDSGKATEAAAHLAKITTNQQDLAEWTHIAQGIYATFGDSLPIEGLTEAANETMRVGKVTGVMADALNWAGVSEDEFNAKLAATNSLSEREELIRTTLNGLYSEAADIYERNNKALLDYNESQAKVDSAMNKAGQAMLPLMTALNNLGSAFFTALKPALDAIIPPIATFINMIAKAIESVMSFFSALTGKNSTIKAVGDIGANAAGAAQGLGTAANKANNLSSGLGSAEKAADGAAKAVEEAKRSTLGFDELNIVSSGTSGSSGSSGSGSPGYATGNLGGGGALFGTEVEETGSAADGIAEKIKKTFEGLKDVFQPTIDAWNSAFDTVKQSWDKAKPDFIDGINKIKSGFTNLAKYVGSKFVPNVVNSFSTNLAPVVGDTFGFIIEEAGKAFSWFGGYVEKMSNDIAIPALQTLETVATGIFDGIGKAWDNNGKKLLSAFSDFFENLRGHFDNFYNNIFKPIWDKVIKVFNQVWTEGLKPLWDNFVDTCLVIRTEVITLYNEVIAPVVDWILTKIFPIIVNVVNGIIETVGRVVTAISNVVSGVITFLKGLIQFIVGVFTGDWGKVWNGIKNIFGGIWQLISGILETFVGVLNGIIDFITNVFTAAWQITWETIKGIWDVVVDYFKKIWEGIVAAFSNVETWFTEKFTQAWNGIKNIWNSVTGWFSGIWTGIKNTYNNVATWFGNIFSNAWTNVKNAFSNFTSFFSGLWNNIKETFSKLGTNIGDAISKSVKSGINGVISMIERTINNAIGLINGAIDLINKLPGVSVGKINRLTLPRLAKGGIVDSATLAVIGEQGREAVVPLENNTGWIDKLVEKMADRLGGSTPVILQIDGKTFAQVSVDSINQLTRQTGNLPLVLV